MSERVEINQEQLNTVNGGAITYTWDGTQGSLGVNGNNPYILTNKEGFLQVYHEMFGKANDVEIIKALLANGYIRKP